MTERSNGEPVCLVLRHMPWKADTVEQHPGTAQAKNTWQSGITIRRATLILDPVNPTRRRQP